MRLSDAAFQRPSVQHVGKRQIPQAPAARLNRHPVGGSGFRHGRRKHREGNCDFHSLRRKFSVVQFRHIDTFHIQRSGSGWSPFLRYGCWRRVTDQCNYRIIIYHKSIIHSVISLFESRQSFCVGRIPSFPPFHNFRVEKIPSY